MKSKSLPEYQRPPVRVALMGLGRAMFADHYPVFLRHPALFKVYAACDLIKQRRDIVAKDCPDCKMFRQLEDMLDERDIDIVDIATCTSDHVRHAMAALKRGVWTLLETPMALTPDDAQFLRGQTIKDKNRLIVFHRGIFAPDFLLAQQMMKDPRLGRVHQVIIRREEYQRRDDWQCVKRLGGGATAYGMTDLLLQALRLLPSPPFQMWSELKRLASLGDAEDYAHVNLKTRDGVSADVEYNGGCVSAAPSPSFVVRGELGTFSVQPGATEGTLVCIDPDYEMPRRRSSVRTPPLRDDRPPEPVKTFTVSLPPNTLYGPSLFWRHVYDTVRTAKPFPLQLEESLEIMRLVNLMKRSSPFGK